MARKFSELRDRMSPEARARAKAITDEITAEMPLNELRRARALTQETLATAMDTTQGEVSKIEKRADIYVSTLRSYVAAMGGELDIVARFKDGSTVKISQFSDLKN